MGLPAINSNNVHGLKIGNRNALDSPSHWIIHTVMLCFGFPYLIPMLSTILFYSYSFIVSFITSNNNYFHSNQSFISIISKLNFITKQSQCLFFFSFCSDFSQSNRHFPNLSVHVLLFFPYSTIKILKGSLLDLDESVLHLR